MADYNSKYTGEEVEQLLDQVANGEVGGETLTEADITNMGFTKNQGTITEVKMNGVSKGTSGVVDLGNVITAHQDISGKVDKVSGKGLSTEDFTTTLKSKLEGLSNYDDTTISNALTTLRSDFDKLVSGDSTTAIKTFNEIIAFLDGIADAEDLASIIASIEQQIATKQNSISDLATIREGAAKGATAIQRNDVVGIVTDEGFITTEDVAKVATTGSYNDLVNKPTIPAEQVNADWDATSGKAQILNKPTIPSAVTERTVSGWGFTKNTGDYSKPSGGIPKSDLANDVQTSLNKADNAIARDAVGDLDFVAVGGIMNTRSGLLYSLPDEPTDEEDDILLSRDTVKTINGQSIFGSGDIEISGGGSGTITEVKANGTSVATSGVANIPAASTSAYGVTKLTSSTSSTSTSLAATASAVKAAYDLANSYKGTVTSVKVNGSSYSPSNGVVDLGTISGGGSSSGGGKEIVVIEPDYSPAGGEAFLETEPNKVYVVSDMITNLTLTSFVTSTNAIDSYDIIFRTDQETAITLPRLINIIWANGTSPILEVATIYELSIQRVTIGGSDFYNAVITPFKSIE